MAAPYHLPHVIDDAPTAAGAAATAYRGFLFSDVRGFTAYAERRGNAAAAEMVATFLDIARKAIARHDGAELKTEGDNIHAVFPSASSAVLCGLDIVEGAAELNAREPDRQLGLGVGIHAGEAVEVAGGVELLRVHQRLHPLGGHVLDVGLAAVDGADLLRGQVEAGDAQSAGGELDGEGKPDVPEADDSEVRFSRAELVFQAPGQVAHIALPELRIGRNKRSTIVDRVFRCPPRCYDPRRAWPARANL